MNPITDICWSCMFPLTSVLATLVPDANPTSQPVLTGVFLQQPTAHRRGDRLLEPVPGRRHAYTLLLVGLAAWPSIPASKAAARGGHDSQTRNSSPGKLVRQPDPQLAGSAARLPLPGTADLGSTWTEVTCQGNDDELV